MRTTAPQADPGAVPAAGDGEDTAVAGNAEDVEPASQLPAWVPSWFPTLLLSGIVLVGVGLRFYARSNLWLDEALSVNISSLPVSDLLEALRHDGHPPLYYLLLHYWMDLVGDSDVAVRALSGILAVASLPLVSVAAHRRGGEVTARWALVLVALSPYWIRYATEARMYALVMLLVLVGYLLIDDALRSPAALRLVGLGLVSGMLLLSHYWAFWLLAAVELWLVWRWWRQPEQRPITTKVGASLAAGVVLFLPWLPSFLDQAAHTGTPWADPVRPLALVRIVFDDLGGGSGLDESFAYGAGLVVLCLLALFALRTDGRMLTLDLWSTPNARPELIVVALTAAIGCVMGFLTDATFQSRYAAVFVPLVFLAAAVGLSRLPGIARVGAGAGMVAVSLIGIVWILYYHRTQSDEVAGALRARAQPGDVVLYCPDQLGPAYSRAMPDDLDLQELAYPRLDRPERVDWVDYAERNAANNPQEIAADIKRIAGQQNIFVVWRGDYDTYDEQCESVVHALTDRRVQEPLVSQNPARFYEPANLTLIRPE